MELRSTYVRVMDKLYAACIVVCVVSIVCMTTLIFTGVVMRYLFSMGARFAEPMSIFFTVQLTMYGAAACFRKHAHLRLELFVRMLPEYLQRCVQHLVHLLMAIIAVFMMVYGYSLSSTTWFQSYPEFDAIKVGLVYSAIPGSGLVTLLFVIEAVFCAPLARERELSEEEELQRMTEHGSHEVDRLKL